MKKKVCYWLDSNEHGSLHVISNQVQACYNACIALQDNVKVYNLNPQIIQEERKKLFEDINSGRISTCLNCKALIEKEEEDINIGPLSTFIMHPFTTCNLRCSYCTLSRENREQKLENKERYILPVIKKFDEAGMLKKDFTLLLGGGEPAMIEDIKEIAEYMNAKKSNNELMLISNSSIANRVDYIIDSLSNLKNIVKVLNTSLDAGTAVTFRKLKERNLFESVCENIKKYAQSGVFDRIHLKYIMMNDHSNLSDADLKGFISFVTEIAKIYNKKLVVVIDADMRVQKKFNKTYYENSEMEFFPITKKQIAFAGKLHAALCNIADVQFLGGRINVSRSDVGAQDVKKILQYSRRYRFWENLRMAINIVFNL